MAAMQGDPPAVARQRVRRALRKAREATSLSQGDIAKKLEWSLSKMQRIEAGEVGVSPTDLRALLDFYGVTDAGEVDRLIADARVSRQQRWLTPPEHRAYLTPALRQLLQFEAEATTIRAYQSVIIPGVMQTSAAAETVLNWSENGISNDERRVRFDVRMQRRRRIVGDEQGPTYLVILDESVIKRQIGGPVIMAEQLEALVDIAQLQNVSIRVLPFEKGALMGLPVPFHVLTLSDDPDDIVAYRESYERDSFVHDPVEARQVRNVFDQLWAECLPEPATIRKIADEAEILRTSTVS
jgi:transcriptional regulator with XRE-family HTH domain